VTGRARLGFVSSSRDGEPDLGIFADGLAVLRQGTSVVGHVATIVDSFRGLFLIKEARVWLLVTWLDGTRERIEEDYRPWTAVAELLNGHFTVEREGREQRFEVEWLSGVERDRAWTEFGILDAVEAYM
jgi:hypothetical protein